HPAVAEHRRTHPAHSSAELDYELCFGKTVFPPTTVRFTLMFMISFGGTSCGSFSSITKSASFPAVIDPFKCSSDDAYAPLIVAMASASSIVTFWFAPQTRPL